MPRFIGSQHIETSWYWFSRHEGIVESSWGLAVGEARRSYWWRCSLRNSLSSRTEELIERTWGLAAWPEPRRDCWWKCSPVTGGTQRFGDASIMGNHQGQHHLWRGVGLSLGDMLCVLQREPQLWRTAEDGEWIADTGQWVFFALLVLFCSACDCAWVLPSKENIWLVLQKPTVSKFSTFKW